MNIIFENVVERDVDLLIMRRFALRDASFIRMFCEKTSIDPDTVYSVLNVSHSVMTNDGETDVEIILSDGSAKTAFLIEDKIDAIAQPEQAKRYELRAKKAIEQGLYDKYYIFIVAPQKYLNNNQEAGKYAYQVSYEEIREVLSDEFEMALIDKALDESKHGYVPVEDRKVTDFWNQLYDFVENNYPDTFNLQGHKGEVRGSNAVWVTMNSGHGTSVVIKADRGFVDLVIPGYADRFAEFSKVNKDVIDQKRLYIRTASKSLTVRKYIEIIDFAGDFSDQIDRVEDAFNKAKELQDLVKYLKF
ncbi:MAG: PD-(D/E)XK nuclease family protein [Lachnospiraceae bacterium]|nr:PD-(D/E)XK nuclease family protein [Lachnospiraceae bacterium]